MVKNSVTQKSRSIRSGQMQKKPFSDWCCIGVDIGKYEHVAVAIEGFSELRSEPIRLGIQHHDYQNVFALIDNLCEGLKSKPVIGMESTGHRPKGLKESFHPISPPNHCNFKFCS